MTISTCKIEDLWDVCDEVYKDFGEPASLLDYKLFFAPDPQYPERQMKINKMILNTEERSVVFIAE